MSIHATLTPPLDNLAVGCQLGTSFSCTVRFLLNQRHIHPRSPSLPALVYRKVNQALMGKTYGKKNPFLLYTKMLLLSLGQLPPMPACTVYRGLSNLPEHVWDKFRDYGVGQTFVFNNFNSSTLSKASGEEFLRKGNSADDRQVFLTIKCALGFSVAAFSVFPAEQEVLLPPGSVFVVAKTRCSGTRLDLEVEQLPADTKVVNALGIQGYAPISDTMLADSLLSKTYQQQAAKSKRVHVMATPRVSRVEVESLSEAKATGGEAGNCSVRILGAGIIIPQNSDENNSTENVALPHGSQYRIQLTNGFMVRCSASLTIDGFWVGDWILTPGQTAAFERPVWAEGKFSFFQSNLAEAAEKKRTDFAPARTGIVEGRSENGMVNCVYTPEATN